MEWGYKINGHCSEPRNKFRMVATKTPGLREAGGREKPEANCVKSFK